jgi:hypothetical protein
MKVGSFKIFLRLCFSGKRPEFLGRCFVVFTFLAWVGSFFLHFIENKVDQTIENFKWTPTCPINQ